jgi:LuxR family transcriptional regulator, maltose regulon positive regulatory protein
MNADISPLVLTKLQTPLARERLVARTHLVELLNPRDGTNLILVCAPAGYGKTTLLAEWARSLSKTGVAVAWYALDEGDDDPIPFRSYLIAGFIQALGPIPELTQIAQLLRFSPEMDLQGILPGVINAILASQRECVLILDDYHLIGSPAIHSALAYLIEHLPQNLRIAIGSRSSPPLPLARLRARWQLLEIHTAGLRFKTEESAQFLNEVMQLGCSSQTVMELEKRTEGWVTGLQLAALALAGRADKEQVIASFSGSHRYLVEYLLEEVVERQPQEVQSFLLSTSILERMCGDLCDALWSGQSAAAQVLKRLERSNLFVVALDDQGEWYRYHHLFRDFLHNRLNKTQAERVGPLQRAACEWLAGKNLLREAARHAFQTEDWEYAADFVEQHCFSLIVYSEISTIYEWCAAIPEEVMERRPMLCIMQGLALAYGFRRQNRDRVEARLQQANRAMAALPDRQAARDLVEMEYIVRTFLAFAPDPAVDPDDLLEMAKGMVDDYPRGDARQFSGLLLHGYAYLARLEARAAAEAFQAARLIALREGLYFGVVEATVHLAGLARSQGQLGRAAELCRQGQVDIAVALKHAEQTLPAMGSLDIELGGVLVELDQLAEGEELLRRGLEQMGGGMNPYYLMRAYLELYRLCVIQRQLAEALKTLARLEAAWPDLAFCTNGLRAVQALQASPDDPSVRARAAAWSQDFLSGLEDKLFTAGMGPFGGAEAHYLARLAWAQIQISLGHPQDALSYLHRQLERALSNGLAQRVIELSLLEALARKAEGDRPRSQAALQRALGAAQPEGYLRIFDRGPIMTQMLAEAARQGDYQEYARSLLKIIAAPESTSQGDRPARPVYDFPAESLSRRELEVLQLIAQGATNQEIAEKLVVTVGTVKSHINHILSKLGAHNRTEAVARARGLGLLEI